MNYHPTFVRGGEPVAIVFSIAFVIIFIYFIIIERRRNKAFKEYLNRTKALQKDRLTSRIEDIIDLYLPKPGLVLTKHDREVAVRAIAVELSELLHSPSSAF